MNRTAALFSLVLLAGCASDDAASRAVVAEGGYVLYDCDALATAIKGTAAHEKELKDLMIKADGGNGVISGLTYRPEYLDTHGRLLEMRRAAAEKKCAAAPR
jgi:hypothetical protein